MLPKEKCQKVIRAFRAKHALDTSDENIIATIHLMNTHGLDIHAALTKVHGALMTTASMHGITTNL